MKRTRLKPMSDKRRAVNAERAEALAVVRARSNERCEAGPMIASVDPVAASRCRGRGIEGHEKQKRSRGGSITDPANIVWTCRPCHDFTEAQPAKATECGLLVPSWGA